jgi:hypothetical protein
MLVRYVFDSTWICAGKCLWPWSASALRTSRMAFAFDRSGSFPALARVSALLQFAEPV